MRPIADSARSLAVARTAPVAFVHAHYRKLDAPATGAHARRRAPPPLWRRGAAHRGDPGQPPLERQSSPPVDATTHELRLDCTGTSMPIYTSASPCGRWFVYVAAVHDAAPP